MDKYLSWNPQIGEVIRKQFAAAGSQQRQRNFLLMTTKVAFAQSLLLLILDYGDVTYLDLTEEQLKKLERFQNSCIRFNIWSYLRVSFWTQVSSILYAFAGIFIFFPFYTVFCCISALPSYSKITVLVLKKYILQGSEVIG